VWYRYSQEELITGTPIIPVTEAPEQEAQVNQYTGLMPPIHDNCHCYIETLPGGRKIWQFGDKCCDQCKNLALQFNKTQFYSFGI
jgi:hypothetical protein